MEIITLDVILTEAERAEYERKRKSDASQLPRYFSAAARRNIPISREFEAFLILTDKSLRSSMTQWLQGTSNRNEVDLGLDGLYKEMLEIDLDDATDEVAAATSELLQFSAFRNRLFADKFAIVPEVRSLIDDLQLGVEVKSRKKDRSQHKLNTISLLQQFNEIVDQTPERRQQAESWIGVLLAY